jgi:NADH-quinone oxidoreductase subunit C
MVPEKICQILQETFGEAIVSTSVQSPHPHAVVNAGRWPEIARFLRDDPRMQFNMLRCISSLDLMTDKKLAAVYDLISMVPGEEAGGRWRAESVFAIRVEMDRDSPHIPSVADVWPAADWHEREAYDLMGIVFDGHPDLRRILCPDDWEGHPLRKDYEFPLEYHGIPATTEYGLTNPRH